MAAQSELDGFVDNTRIFLTELAQNNSRDWFYDQKSRYDAFLKRPAEILLDQLVPDLSRLSGAAVRPKLFRPHRDVRFSEDKTPYHVHLHMLWSLPDGRAWFFGLSPDYATAGAGVMQFDSPGLERYREAVASAAGAELDGMAETIGARVDPPVLKRVPAPYEADHERADWLRRKQLVFWLDGLETDLQSDPANGLRDAFERLAPLQDWIARNM